MFHGDLMGVREKGHRTPYGIHTGGMEEKSVPFLRMEECGYLPEGCPWDFKDVYASLWRVYFNPKPGWSVEWNGKVFKLGPGTLVGIPAGLNFNCHGVKGIPHFWFHFSVLPDYRFSLHEPVVVKTDAAFAQSFNHLANLYAQGDSPENRRVIYHRSFAILHTFFSCFQLTPQDQIPSRLIAVIDHIQQNPALPFTNQELARRMGLSVEGFIRLFRKHLDFTPAQYIRKTRISQACRLLAFTNQSMEGIAETLGFPNRHYFSRVFRVHTGTTPAAFRNKQRHSLSS